MMALSKPLLSLVRLILEAFSLLILIGRGIRDTTAHAVSNRYGEKVADATKQGFNVIGNLGKIVTVYKEEATEYIHEQNGKSHVHNTTSYETRFKSD